MESMLWAAEHWFDLLQTVGIVSGLLFTAYAVRKDERARKIGNLIAIKQQYREIWQELYDRPKLFRVLQKDADVLRQLVSDEEHLFVKLLIIHLDTVHRAMKSGLFVRLGGIQEDIKEFMSLPIPKTVWEKLKPFQDDDFIQFIEGSLAAKM